MAAYDRLEDTVIKDWLTEQFLLMRDIRVSEKTIQFCTRLYCQDRKIRKKQTINNFVKWKISKSLVIAKARMQRQRGLLDKQNQIYWKMFSKDIKMLNFELSVATSDYIVWILKIINQPANLIHVFYAFLIEKETFRSKTCI